MATVKDILILGQMNNAFVVATFATITAVHMLDGAAAVVIARVLCLMDESDSVGGEVCH